MASKGGKQAKGTQVRLRSQVFQSSLSTMGFRKGRVTRSELPPGALLHLAILAVSHGQDLTYIPNSHFCLFVLPALLQKLVGEFFFDFGEGNLGGKFFGPTKIRAQKFRGKFRSVSREKFHSSKRIFRANFGLQTCHPNFLGFSEKDLELRCRVFTIPPIFTRAKNA